MVPSKWMSITSIAHRVSLAGRVEIGIAKGNDWIPLSSPVKPVTVDIIKGPERFMYHMKLKALSHGTAWEGLSHRPDRTLTAVDGSFYFVDLPDGDYELQAIAPRELTHLVAIKSAVISVQSSAKLAFITLKLANTGIMGLVTKEDDKTPIPFAKVQVLGSGEQVRCDDKGKYQLLNLEVSPKNKRNVKLYISQRRYTEITTDPIPIKRGEVVAKQDFQLTLASV